MVYEVKIKDQRTDCDGVFYDETFSCSSKRRVLWRRCSADANLSGDCSLVQVIIVMKDMFQTQVCGLFYSCYRSVIPIINPKKTKMIQSVECHERGHTMNIHERQRSPGVEQHLITESGIVRQMSINNLQGFKELNMNNCSGGLECVHLYL